MHKKLSRRQRLPHAIMDNSLTIVLFALFVVCIFAQSFAGWRLQNVTLAAHGQALIGYWRNLSTRHISGGPRLQLAGCLPATGLPYCVQRFPLSARRPAFP